MNIHLLAFADQQIRDRSKQGPAPDDVDLWRKNIGILGAWRNIAGRDGAMALYNYGKALEAISELLGNPPLGLCPTLRNLIDYKAFKAQRKRFDTAFPNIILIRHAVSHAAELMAHPADARQNLFSGDYSGGGIEIKASGFGGGLYVDGVYEDTVTRTIDGKVLTYKLSGKSALELEAIRLAVWAIFQPPE